jgi:uncharacterized protein YeaO (DUF488 family)
MSFAVKRVYDAAAKTDGMRVLVDRLWPRGLTKAKAKVDEWMKDIAPSTELRKWYHSPRGEWTEFRSRYRRELAANKAAVTKLRALGRKGRVTLLYGVHDTERNHAIILRAYLTKR